MIKQIIRLVRPGVFMPYFEEEDHDDFKVIVRPRYLSVCAADQRYFQGNRPADVLAKKLPMSLFHEATGIVLFDPTHTFEPGQNVVLLPGGVDDNIDNNNYRANAFFRSSNYDGFCQELLHLDLVELIPIPSENPYLFVFSELLSVCCHAFRRLQKIATIKEGQSVGIWGDGPLGYLMAFTLHALAPQLRLEVFGKHNDKLMMFSFVDSCINIQNPRETDQVDYAFECVGGQASKLAIEHIIEHIRPCGVVTLLGVSEVPPVINTRSVLEKGLLLQGCSRSQRQDFEVAVDIIYKKGKSCQFDKFISCTSVITGYSSLMEIFAADYGYNFKTIAEVTF